MSDPPPLASIERILVRGVNWIGDTILTLPAIEALRNLLPGAHITLLVKDHLRSLFRRSPWVDEIIDFPRSRGMKLLAEEAKLVRAIRRSRYDLALVLPRSPRAALTPYCAGIRYRVGYACNGRSILFTHSLKESSQLLQLHQADYYYQLVKFLGARGFRQLPRLSIGCEEAGWATSFCDGAGISRNHTLIALNPGSTYGPAKCWPAARYIQLARRLLSSPRNRLLLVGGADNAGLIDYMYLSLNHRVTRAVGKDLNQLAALLQRSDLLITNDTGPMHVAAAVGTPVVALFGSTDPRTTSPLGPRSRLIRRQTDCSPCLKRCCPYDHRCMTAIAVDEVEAVVYDQLSDSGGSGPQTATGLS